MKVAFLVAATMLVGFSLATPGAVAFHGAPYRAEGVATIVLLGQDIDFHATLFWNGVGFGGVGSYKMELRTMPGELLVHTHTFNGGERFTNFAFPPAPEDGPGCVTETLDYEGFSTPDATILDIWGYQHNHLCTGEQEMHYEGTYLDFTVTLDVWSAL